MKKIETNATGLEVKFWQAFLQKQNLLADAVPGTFDRNTYLATVAFQSAQGLGTDGVVGNNTVNAAKNLGFVDVFAPDFPRRPKFGLIGNNEARAVVFGKFEFRHKPVPDNKENIEILGSWEDENIITIEIPQLIRLKGSAKARFHKLAAAKAQKIFADWDNAGLMDRVISWGGSFVPRFARGSTSSLSNHAFGSAFDINFDENPLNKTPVMVGQKGCVRELVQIANENGYFWGGHFSPPREDGMHFELAIVGDMPTDSAMRARGLAVEIEDDGQDMF